MSRKAYTQEERESIRTSMLRRSARVFAEKGLRNASLEDIYSPEGISKTFFYSFFPSKNDRIVLFADILNMIGVPVSRMDPRVFYNMLMSIVWAHCSHQASMPFLYSEVARTSSEIQIERLIEYLGSLRVDSGIGDKW